MSTTGYSGVLLRSLSLSLSFSSLMGRHEPSVKYSISSMSSLVSLRISDSSLKKKKKHTLKIMAASQDTAENEQSVSSRGLGVRGEFLHFSLIVSADHVKNTNLQDFLEFFNLKYKSQATMLLN